MRLSLKLFIIVVIAAFGILAIYNIAAYYADVRYNRQINQWNDYMVAGHNANIQLGDDELIGHSYNTNGTHGVFIPAMVLENGTTAMIWLDVSQKQVYLSGDTVWANIADHYIDDVNDNTMKVVLRPLQRGVAPEE